MENDGTAVLRRVAKLLALYEYRVMRTAVLGINSFLLSFLEETHDEQLE